MLKNPRKANSSSNIEQVMVINKLLDAMFVRNLEWHSSRTDLLIHVNPCGNTQSTQVVSQYPRIKAK